MNILVTGGCGFIGSHFVRLVLDKYPSDRVINLDALTYAAHPETKTELDKYSASGRYSFIHADIATVNFEKVLTENRVEAVVNFAAESHVDRSILDPGAFVRTNVNGVLNLITAARKAGNPRFVHVSTDEVYGTLTPTASAFTEHSTLDPNSPYAASKASADLIALACQRTYQQPILITRCSNNYGPYQFPEKLLPLVIANALEDQSIPIYGDGKQVRDWIYVEDHCTGIDAVLRKGRVGEVYNISAAEERFNIDLVKQVLGILKKPESLMQHVGDRPAHDRRYALDSRKIRSELGWSPANSFGEGLKKTIDWYLSRQDWWKKVRGKDYYQYYQANYAKKFAT